MMALSAKKCAGSLVWVLAGAVAMWGRPACADYLRVLRVSDLDDLLKRLRQAGIEVVTKPEWDQLGIGRFARIHDPERKRGGVVGAGDVGDADPGSGWARRLSMSDVNLHED